MTPLTYEILTDLEAHLNALNNEGKIHKNHFFTPGLDGSPFQPCCSLGHVIDFLDPSFKDFLDPTAPEAENTSISHYFLHAKFGLKDFEINDITGFNDEGEISLAIEAIICFLDPKNTTNP